MSQVKYVDSNYQGPILIKNYLQKLKSPNAKSRIFGKFNKRFFILDLGNYFFAYKDKESSGKLTTFPLTDLINVDPNPRIIDVCDWKFAFVIQLGNRIFHLYADSVSVHNEWCTALKACLKPLERLIYENSSQIPRPSRSTNSPVEALDPVPKAPVHENALNDPQNIPLPHKLTSEPAEPEVKYASEHLQKDLKNSPEPIKKPLNAEENSLKRPDLSEFRRSAEVTNEVIQSRKVYLDASSNNENPSGDHKKTVSNPPKYEAIKSNYRPDPSKGKENERKFEEDEEVTVISGPKRVVERENDGISQATPIIYRKERPSLKNTEPEPKKNVYPTVEEPVINMNPFVKKATDIKVEFKSGGMLEIMNEFNDLGLETEVRTVNELKKKIVSEKSQEKFRIEVKKEEKTEEKTEKVGRNEKKVKGNQVEGRKKSECFEKIEDGTEGGKKTGLGKITVKAGFNKVPIKVGYVEKPEIVPDKAEFVQAKKQKHSSGHGNRVVKAEKATFSEKNEKINPQGTDCDWDEWDNE